MRKIDSCRRSEPALLISHFVLQHYEYSDNSSKKREAFIRDAGLSGYSDNFAEHWIVVDDERSPDRLAEIGESYRYPWIELVRRMQDRIANFVKEHSVALAFTQVKPLQFDVVETMPCFF